MEYHAQDSDSVRQVMISESPNIKRKSVLFTFAHRHLHTDNHSYVYYFGKLEGRKFLILMLKRTVGIANSLIIYLNTIDLMTCVL